MKSPTVSFEFRASRVRADGTSPVLFRSTFGRASCYITTGVNVEKRHWNAKKKRVAASCPIAALLNRQLDDLYRRGLEASFSAGSAEEVINALSGSTGTFTGFVEELIESMDGNTQQQARKKYQTMLREVHECMGAPLGWAAITAPALRKYEKFLKDARGNNPTTVHRKLSRLRTVVNKAIRDGVLKRDRNPFDRFTMPKKSRPLKRMLTWDEIEKLEALELEWGTRERTVRDMFLVSFYASGIRISDALRLTIDNINGNVVEYTVQKTGEVQRAELPPEGVEALRPYLKEAHERGTDPPTRNTYPFLFKMLQMGNARDLRRRQSSANVMYNVVLKKVASLAGVDPAKPLSISSHTARHSFGNLARHHAEWGVVSLAMGHSDPATTRSHYIAREDSEAASKLTRTMFERRDDA